MRENVNFHIFFPISYHRMVSFEIYFVFIDMKNKKQKLISYFIMYMSVIRICDKI